MSKLKALNVFFLQFFFVRLTKHREDRVENYIVLGYDLMPDGSISPRANGSLKSYEWFSIQYWVLPLTGWWSDYIFLNKKPKFTKITTQYKV